MIGFIDVSNMARWVRDTGAAPILSDLVTALESDFRRWQEFDKVPRLASHSPLGVIELMPTSDAQNYGFKYVNGHPGNPARGRQTVTAFGVLADVVTGYPTLIAEMTILTALRTAATSAMAARALARPGSTTMALIGTGSQAEFQALAFRELLNINYLRIWDTDPEAMAKFVRNAAPLGLNVYQATNADDAARGADIVTTCTADKSNAIVLANSSVAAGMHINAIGGDCPGKTELDARILNRADVFVEYEPQTRVEGEIQKVSADFPVTELWRVLTGAAPAMTSPEQITVFDSVGFAIEDFTALRYLQQATLGTDHLAEIDVVAEPSDPKDLYGLISGVTVPLAN